MPIVARANVTTAGRGRPSPGEGVRGGGRGDGGEGRVGGRLFGNLISPLRATLTATVSRTAVESLQAPSLAYNVAIKLAGSWIPTTDLLGPFEIDESIDTPATLFTFTLVGRRWSIQATTSTWTAAPVEIWVTAGPVGAARTWRRAFGHVITCEQLEGLEPTLRVRCGDPSRLYDRHELCHEIPAGAGLTRGEICTVLLADLDLTANIPTGALYTKPLITDSQRLWDFLRAFGEPESWSWRFTDWQTVEARRISLREHPEPPDDIWTLRDVLSIESAPPADIPSQWVIRSTAMRTDPAGIDVTTTTSEVWDFYAIKKAVALQHTDGTRQPLTPSSTEHFRGFRKSSTRPTSRPEGPSPRSPANGAGITREPPSSAPPSPTNPPAPSRTATTGPRPSSTRTASTAPGDKRLSSSKESAASC